MLTIRAPAKINLTLEALGDRPDGFHEIRSVIQAVSLCDTLHFEASEEVTYKSGMSDWDGEESLVSKTVTLLKEATGCLKGASIEVEKRIPLVSGLGGDSSDAAAALKGLNRLWELDLPRERLLGMARFLGSDVSFFLYGGTALAEGKGEFVTPLPSLSPAWYVLMMPQVPRLPDKTRRLYQALNKNHYTGGEITRKIAEELTHGRQVPPSMLFNTFENIAFGLFPGLGEAREHLIKLGVTDIHLAGSGPTLFTPAEGKAKAEELCSVLQKQGMTCHAVQTLLDTEI
jgi:4-diphosphocytidyl-2-C-methyl-D-erythritol kinase